MSWAASTTTPASGTPTKPTRPDDDVTMGGASADGISGDSGRPGATNGAQDYDVAEEDFDVAE